MRPLDRNGAPLPHYAIALLLHCSKVNARGAFTLALHAVVRRFLRDDHVMDVRLPEAGIRDSGKAAIPPELLHAAATAVPHAGLQAPHQLVDVRGQRSAERDPPLDPPGAQLALLALLLLQLAIAAPHPGPNPKSSEMIFTGVRVPPAFFDTLDRHEPL